MKKKWFMTIPALALLATPVAGQSVQAADSPAPVKEASTSHPVADIAPEHQPTLSQGSTGLEVEFVQEKLVYYGFDTDVDGVFGPETDEQIRQFQADKNLTVDGVVGTNTWVQLLVNERFLVADAKAVLTAELDNDDLVFSSNGEIHQNEQGEFFYTFKAASQSLIENGGSGTVGFYNVYGDGTVEEDVPQ